MEALLTQIRLLFLHDVSQHFDVLLVVLPLMAAPLCSLISKDKLAWAWTTLITWICLFLSAALLYQCWHDLPVGTWMGGWEPPWGIEYRIDLLSAFVLFVVTAIAALTMIYARASVEKEIPKKKRSLFYTAFLLCFTGLLGMTATGDAFNVFVFLEISSLSSYALIAMGRDRRALTAAYRYLIMGTIGATFILLGIGFIYMMTGTLNMADLAQRLPEVNDTRTVRAAFALLTVGIGIKLAIFPLHRWLPNAYGFAPSVVTVFLASTATKVALYILLRFVFTVFGADFSFGEMHLGFILCVLSPIAIIFTSVIAIFRRNCKRLLAYSSVAQIGYMTLGVGLVSTTGLMAGLLHLFNHAMIKGSLFMALGCIFYRTGSTHLKDMKGIGRKMPWTMAAFVIGGLSLIGVPLTVGFISKWFLLQALFERGWWPMAALVLIGSLIAVIYIWRIFEAAYFEEPCEKVAEIKEAPLSMLIPTWAMAIANLYFGLNTELTVDVTQKAASLLMGGTP